MGKLILIQILVLTDPRIEEQPLIQDREPEVEDATNEEELSAEQLGESEDSKDAESKSNDGKIIVEPTPTGSEEQTHYILPQKNEEPQAKIYISPVPKPNSYSRQPKFYVDVNPAKSVDFVVTATPSRAKPYTGRSSFASRFK